VRLVSNPINWVSHLLSTIPLDIAVRVMLVQFQPWSSENGVVCHEDTQLRTNSITNGGQPSLGGLISTQPLEYQHSKLTRL